jgi:hypothetical protein
MADLQSFFLPPAGIHPAINGHNYDLGGCSGILGEGSEGGEGSATVGQGEIAYSRESTIISGVLV